MPDSAMSRREILKSGAVLAAASGCLLANPTETMPTAAGHEGQPVKVGFARSSIMNTLRKPLPARRPLEVICAVFVQGDQSVVLAALDLCEFPPEDARKLQDEIAALTGIPAQQVLLHTTHTHSAPMDVVKPGLAWRSLKSTSFARSG